MRYSVSEARETEGDGVTTREIRGTRQRSSYSLYKCVIQQKPWCPLNYHTRHCDTALPRLVAPATLQLTSRPLPAHDLQVGDSARYHSLNQHKSYRQCHPFESATISAKMGTLDPPRVRETVASIHKRSFWILLSDI